MSNKIAKNDIKFFDAVFENYYKPSNEVSTKISIALQAFVEEPKRVAKKIQAVGVSTDFERLTKDAFNVTIEEDNFDLGWEKAFRSVTLGRGQDSWEIYTVTNGITFNKVEEGARIQVDEMTGAKVQVSVDYYGGALGWTDAMFRFRKVPSMIEKAMAFRNKFWEDKADNHYLLLATAANVNAVTALQGVAADGALRRNVKTINTAIFTLTNRLKNKGYGNMATAPVIMYANPFDEDAIEAAFRATTTSMGSALGQGQQITKRRVIRIYTYTDRIVAGQPIYVLPGQKIQRADVMAPTTYTAQKDILTLNETQAVWAIYGAAVADTDQVQKSQLSN